MRSNVGIARRTGWVSQSPPPQQPLGRERRFVCVFDKAGNVRCPFRPLPCSPQIRERRPFLRAVGVRRRRAETGIMDTVEPAVVSRNEMLALLAALTALKQGESSVRLPLEWTGLAGKLAAAFNDVVDQNARMADELLRLAKTVGKQGKLRQRATLGDARGFWKVTIDGVNSLID